MSLNLCGVFDLFGLFHGFTYLFICLCCFILCLGCLICLCCLIYLVGVCKCLLVWNVHYLLELFDLSGLFDCLICLACFSGLNGLILCLCVYLFDLFIDLFELVGLRCLTCLSCLSCVYFTCLFICLFAWIVYSVV